MSQRFASLDTILLARLLTPPRRERVAGTPFRPAVALTEKHLTQMSRFSAVKAPRTVTGPLMEALTLWDQGFVAMWYNRIDVAR